MRFKLTLSRTLVKEEKINTLCPLETLCLAYSMMYDILLDIVLKPSKKEPASTHISLNEVSIGKKLNAENLSCEVDVLPLDSFNSFLAFSSVES